MKSLLTLFSIIAIILSGFFFIDNRYAQVDNMKQIEQRLDYKILSDQYKVTLDRIWQLDDRFRGRNMDTTSAEEYRQLKETKEILKNKLLLLEKENK